MMPRRKIFVGTSSGKEKSTLAFRRFSDRGLSFSSPVMNFAASIFAVPADDAITTKKSALPVTGAILPSLIVRMD